MQTYKNFITYPASSEKWFGAMLVGILCRTEARKKGVPVEQAEQSSDAHLSSAQIVFFPFAEHKRDIHRRQTR